MKYCNKKYKKQQIIDEFLSHFLITEKKKKSRQIAKYKRPIKNEEPRFLSK